MNTVVIVISLFLIKFMNLSGESEYQLDPEDTEKYEDFKIEETEENDDNFQNLDPADLPGDKLHEIEEQLEFMKNFACYLAVQSKFRENEDQVKSIVGNLNTQLKIKNIVGKLYGICLNKMDADTQTKYLSAQTQKDMKEIVFDHFEEFPMYQYLNEEVPSLNEEDSNFYDEYQELEEKVAKMREDLQQKNKKPEQDQSDTNSNPYSSQNEMNIFGYTFTDKNKLYILTPVILILVLPLFILWRSIFKEPEIHSKKKKKKKKLK